MEAYAASEHFEYWLCSDGEVYRNQIGNRGPFCQGKPSNARWECSKAHFDHFRAVIMAEGGLVLEA